MTNITAKYEKTIKNMVTEFMHKYYKTGEKNDIYDYHIIGDIMEGRYVGPVCVNEYYYYSIDEIYEALANNFTKEKIEDWYEFSIEQMELPDKDRDHTLFYNYCKFGETPSATEEELKICRANVEYAEKQLEKAILDLNNKEDANI